MRRRTVVIAYHYQYHDNTLPSNNRFRERRRVYASERNASAAKGRTGLGRAGTLVGLYLMKHYGFTARQVRCCCRRRRAAAVATAAAARPAPRDAWASSCYVLSLYSARLLAFSPLARAPAPKKLLSPTLRGRPVEGLLCQLRADTPRATGVFCHGICQL
jgi:hypothetical protein